MATTSKKTTKTPRSGKAAIRHRNRSNVVPAAPFVTKTEHTIEMLRRMDGASHAEVMDARLAGAQRSRPALRHDRQENESAAGQEQSPWRADALLHRADPVGQELSLQATR